MMAQASVQAATAQSLRLLAHSQKRRAEANPRSTARLAAMQSVAQLPCE